MYEKTIRGRNVPYVKKFDDNGKVTNPIVGIYSSGKSDRKLRRSFNKKQ